MVVDGKSGVSGAGKRLTESNSFCQAAEGIAPYAPVGHHHQAEIESAAHGASGAPVTVTFTRIWRRSPGGCWSPRTGGMARAFDQQAATALYHDRYADEPFVSYAESVRTQSARGTNLCQVKAWVDDPERTVIVVPPRSTTWSRARPARRCRTPT